MGLTTYDEWHPYINEVRLTDATGTDWTSVTYPNDYNLRVDSLNVATDAAVDHLVQLSYLSGGNYFVIGTVNIPAGSGYSAAPPVDLVGVIASSKIGGFLAYLSNSLDIKLLSALGSGEVMDVLAMGGYM